MLRTLNRLIPFISLIIASCSQEIDTQTDYQHALSLGCGLDLASNDFKFDTALATCADNGHSEAQAWLGMMFWSDSLKIDQPLLGDHYPSLSAVEMQTRGASLLKAAADSGNALAANEWGLAHLQGNYGQKIDYSVALKWLEIADQAGDGFASQNLAIMYVKGNGVVRSNDKALEFLERAADRGAVVALWTMGAWHAAQATSGSKEKSETYFAEADRLGGKCQRPSEICEDFLPLFEDERALIVANDYVSQASVTTC